MRLDRLLGYLAAAAWIGGLWSGATNLAADGRWVAALVPTGLSVLTVIALAVLIRRDHRRGTVRAHGGGDQEGQR